MKIAYYAKKQSFNVESTSKINVNVTNLNKLFCARWEFYFEIKPIVRRLDSNHTIEFFKKEDILWRGVLKKIYKKSIWSRTYFKNRIF